MPTYEFSLPSGETFEIDSDAELNEQQLSYVASNHKQFLQAAEEPTVAQEFAKGTKGTLAFVGDIASGLVKMPVQAAAAVMAKAVDPSKNYDELWKAAGESIEGYSPSFGSTIGDNAVYSAAMKPFELYGKGVDYAAEQLSMGNKDVEGALKIAGNFAPVPFLGKAGRAAKGLAERVDPGLRRITPETARRDPVANLDVVAPKQEPVELPAHKEAAAPIDLEYLQQRRAQEAALAYDVPKPPGFDEAMAREEQARQQNAAFLDEQANQRAALEQHQASMEGPPSPTTSELEAAVRNRKFLDEQQAVREQLDQLQGPKPPSPEEVIAKRNQDFLEQYHADVEQRAKDREAREAQRQAELEAEKAQRDAELQSRSEEYNKRQQELLSQMKESRPQAGLSTGERMPGGTNVSRTPVTTSGVMGTQKVSEPFRALTGRAIPKSQRGGIDFDAISKGISKVLNRNKSPLSNIPGHEQTASMLTTYAKPEDITAQVSKYGKDVKLINQSLRSGMSHTYVFNDHPLFRAMGDLFQTAAKRTDMQIQKYVSPVQDALISLRRSSQKEYVQLSKVFLKEMFERRKFTTEQLQQAGFTPKQIAAYEQTRQMFQAAAARMNEVLKAKELPELTESEHYLASRRTGDYAQYFYDKQGRLVWMTKDASTWEAKKTKEWLHKNIPELDTSKTHIEVRKSSTGGIEDPAASFAAMLLRFGDEPIVGKIKDAMLTKDAAAGIKAFQQHQHLKSKANIRGFEGDKPWLSDKENAQDLFSQQLHYARNAFAWSELNSANDVASQVLRDENMVKKFPEAVKHAQMYADRNMGKEGQLFKNFDSWIGRRMRLSGASVRKGAGVIKDLWVSQKMITNPGNLVQNTLQPINTIPYHMMLSDKGYNHNPAKTFLLASADTLGGMAQHYGNKLGITKTSHAMTELGREATKYAEDNLILDLSPFNEQQSIEKAYVSGVTETAKVAREVNQITNKSANFAAFMSFVHHLDQSGKFKTRTELFKEAEHWMNASMVDPRPGERPFMVQDTGSVGSLAYGLQSYVLNKYNTLAGFIDHGVKSGSVKGWAPFATALTADIALAGVKGFIPLATYMAIADAINANTEEDWLPDPRKALMEIGDSVGSKVEEVAGEKAGQFASDVMATGTPGAAVGLIPGSKAMDLGPRFASLPSVPGLGMAMDIGRQVGDVATGLTNAVKGDERGLWQAANAVAPVGLIKGSTEALGPFSNPKTMDTNVRTLESTGYKRDDTDKLFKAIGIPSLAENKAKDQSYQFNRLNKIDRERALKIADRFANNIVTGRPVSEGDVAMLVKNYPDVAQALLTSEVNKKALQWNVDAETLHAIQLNTLSKIERYKEVYGTKR